MQRDAVHEAQKRQGPRTMALCRKRMADNALDACGSSRRCDRRYTVSVRGTHADPPRVFSALLRHPV